MICICHSSSWPGVIASHTEGAWRAQIAVSEQLWDPGYSTGVYKLFFHVMSHESTTTETRSHIHGFFLRILEATLRPDLTHCGLWARVFLTLNAQRIFWSTPFLYFRLITSNFIYFQRETRCYLAWVLSWRREFSSRPLTEFWWHMLSVCQVCDWGIQYHLCSTYRGLWGLMIVWLSWLSGRALVAQPRGVLGSTPGDQWPFPFPLLLPHDIHLFPAWGKMLWAFIHSSKNGVLHNEQQCYEHL